MPGYDQTGPNGEGPLTGRGFGPCGRSLSFRGNRKGSGRGLGLSRGFGFKRVAFAPVITGVEEKEILKEELAALKEEMKEIEARLNELNKSKEK